MGGLDLEVVRGFTVALLLGALVGVEREKSQSASGHSGFAGLRTFILLALLGSLSGWLSRTTGSAAILPVVFAFTAVAVVVGHVLENRSRPQAVGMSTEFAALAVFLLGAVAVLGYTAVAVALGILVSAVLAFKQPLHGLVARIDTGDLYAVLQLLIASFIVLPLLPDAAVDPWQALNPYRLWLLVILISALSLVGYVAVRLLGSAHGSVLTGIAGGLVSSTAVSLSFARQSRADPTGATADALAAGVLGAWAVMFLRVIVTVAIVQRDLLPTLVLEFGVLAAAAALLALGFYLRGLRRSRATGAELPLSNPFSLPSAIQFALLFAVVLVIVRLTEEYAPPGSLYVVAGFAGLTDVDAITLSVAQSAGRDLDHLVATTAIGIAALANTLVKCGLVVALGRGPLRGRLVLATALLVAVAACSRLLL